jgi:hypothetical protein
VIVLFPIRNIPDEGHYSFRKKWDLQTRQDKFESILEIIESVVSSPFVKADADSVEYVVLCLKWYVRLFQWIEVRSPNTPLFFKR